MMLKLCHLSWSCSRKPTNIKFCLYLQQIHNFSSLEHESETVRADSNQIQSWRRVKKNSPLIGDILHLPATRQCVKMLADVMECEENIVEELISRDSCLVTSKNILEKVKLLKSYGISSDDIVANPSVLHRSLAVLNTRLQVVEKVAHWTGAISLNAIKGPEAMFEKFIQRNKHDFEVTKNFTSREQFLAHLFQCDEKTVSSLVEINKLLSISPMVLHSKMDILTKYNISHIFVRENCRILFHTSVVELDKRLALLHEKQVLQNNANGKLSYLLSCQNSEFLKSLNIMSGRKEALEGCKDKIEYTCFRLQCSEAAAKNFMSSKHINKLSEVKLKQTFDFLLKEIHMNPDFVIKHRSLFMYSIERLRKRWFALCSAGYNDVTMLPAAVTINAKKFSNKFGSYVFVDTFNDPEK